MPRSRASLACCSSGVRSHCRSKSENAGLGASDAPLGGDAQLPIGGRARLPDDDVDIAAKRGEQAEQALQGILAEVAPQEPRHVGLGKAEHAPGLGQSDSALAHDGVNAADQLRLEQVGVGHGVAEVGEDVAAAAFDGRVGCGHGSTYHGCGSGREWPAFEDAFQHLGAGGDGPCAGAAHTPSLRTRETLRKAARVPPMHYRDNPQQRLRHHIKWTDFAPPLTPGPAVSRRNRVLQHLRNRLAVDPKPAHWRKKFSGTTACLFAHRQQALPQNPSERQCRGHQHAAAYGVAHGRPPTE